MYRTNIIQNNLVDEDEFADLYNIPVSGDNQDQGLEEEYIENSDDDDATLPPEKKKKVKDSSKPYTPEELESELDSILKVGKEFNAFCQHVGPSEELRPLVVGDTSGYFALETYFDVTSNRSNQRINDIINGFDTNPNWLPTGRRDIFLQRLNKSKSSFISTPTGSKASVDSPNLSKQSFNGSVSNAGGREAIASGSPWVLPKIDEEVELDSWGLPKHTKEEWEILMAYRRYKAKGLLDLEPKSLQPVRPKMKLSYFGFANREQQYIAKEQRMLVRYQKKMRKKLGSELMKKMALKNAPRVDPQKELEKLAKKKCSEVASMVDTFWKKQKQLFEIYETKLLDEAKKKKREGQLMSVIDRSSFLTKLMIPGVSNSVESTANGVKEDDDLDDMDKFLKSLPAGYLDEMANNLPDVPANSLSDEDEEMSIEEEFELEPVALPKRRSLRSKSGSSVSSKDDRSSVMSSDVNPVKGDQNGTGVENRRSPRRLVNGSKKIELPLMEKGADPEIKAVETDVFVVPKSVSPQRKNKPADIVDSEMNNLAKIADSFKHTGSTYETAKVKVAVPSILDAKLREYQHIGLDWLVSLFSNKLNGILADEMGLGKTVQTISFLAYLAEEKQIWGPHLIVVPTSVLLNWEREFKRFCPSMKVLTYFGSTKERAEKRKGWKKENSFNICITTYDLYIRDTRMFKWRAWQCLVLDEAHNIKNSKSLRWNKLLSLRTRIRILLTGTPLQNNLIELWSLLYFLMPSVFASQDDFKNWFNDPMNAMIEGSVEYNSRIIDKLHTVLRPFILRRLKSEVEKQMPLKLERVVYCPLSRLQRNLYNAFLRQRGTIDSIRGGSAVSIMNIVMQLRKCCNHPNLFIPMTCKTPIRLPELSINFPCSVKQDDVGLRPFLDVLKGDFINVNGKLNDNRYNKYVKVEEEQRTISFNKIPELSFIKPKVATALTLSIDTEKASIDGASKKMRWLWNVTKEIRDNLKPSLPQQISIFDPCDRIIRSQQERLVQKYGFAPFDVFAGPPRSNLSESVNKEEEKLYDDALRTEDDLTSSYHYGSMVECHDPRLVEIDCGKLRMLSKLLRQLKLGGHRCLIFTQMSKMLDILEIFLTYQKHMYFRLDGSTPIQQRQILMDRFNADDRIFVFILSTRSGGIGMNLTGADTVVFYDSDWNPTMDAQAQDRCHRIGQTRNVVIYRLISASTIEENILKRAFHKRKLGEMALDEGGFTPAFAEKANVRELFEGEEALQDVLEDCNFTLDKGDMEKVMSKVEDPNDVKAAEELRKEIGEEAALVEDEFEDMIQNQLSSVERRCFNFYRDEHKDLLDEKLKEFENAQDAELSTNASDLEMPSEEEEISTPMPKNIKKRPVRKSLGGPQRKRVRFSTGSLKTRSK